MTGPQGFGGIIAMLAVQRTATTNAAPFLLIAGLIAGIRRTHAIGGWLFFFFAQTLVGLVISITDTSWRQFTERYWKDPKLHLAFTVTHTPRLLMLLAVVAICIALVWTFDWQWVIALRYALIVYCGLGLVAVLVDTLYFPNRVSLDGASIITPAIYTGYFFHSTRVQRVFRDRDWHPEIAS